MNKKLTLVSINENDTAQLKKTIQKSGEEKIPFPWPLFL